MRKATYFFGARTMEDMILAEEIKLFEEKLSSFTFSPCLSRPSPEDEWIGEVGRVTDLIEKYILDGENKEAYLCGSKAMIESTIEVLKKKGIPESLIYYDKFD
jgi:Na+-transporting NADH:ubiquinone oxidoreductase subunit F